MNKHTRGPWIQNDGFIYRETTDKYRYLTAPIARALADLREIPLEEMEANARLIAAAPMMLAVLKSLAAVDPQDRALPGFQADIESIIAKAEGRA